MRLSLKSMAIAGGVWSAFGQWCFVGRALESYPSILRPKLFADGKFRISGIPYLANHWRRSDRHRLCRR
jgi:hypothetical protein